MPINSRIENKMWNIHKMEYRAAMRLNDLVTCTSVCSFYKIPLPHPHHKVHPGWLGSQVRDSVLILWWPPSAVYLSSPREEVCCLWRTRNWSWRRTRRGGMHGKGTKAPLLTGEYIQMERKWNSARIPSDLHNITRSCHGVITFPWQIKK